MPLEVISNLSKSTQIVNVRTNVIWPNNDHKVTQNTKENRFSKTADRVTRASVEEKEAQLVSSLKEKQKISTHTQSLF